MKLKFIPIIMILFGKSLFCKGQTWLTPALKNHIDLFWQKEERVQPDKKESLKGQPHYKEFNHREKQIIFFGTSHDIRDTSSLMFDQIEEQINLQKPTVILVEAYGAINPTKTAAKAGDIFFCAYMGDKNNIPVSCWDNAQNDLYYSLLKKYTSDELVVMLVSRTNVSGSMQAYPSFYNSYVTLLETGGWAINPAQKQVAHYYKKYKEYFHLPFKTLSSGVEMEARWRHQSKNTTFTRFFQSFEFLRDIALLNSLHTALQTHNKVFIQAGLWHLASLEKIIPQLLIQWELESKSLPALPEDSLTINDSAPKENPLISKIKGKTSELLLFATDHSIKNYADSQFAKIRQSVNTFKPDLILTEGFDPIFSTEQETAATSGDVGFCRHLGIESNIRINSWAPSWNEVYYELAKKYKPDDIYYTLIAWAILRDSTNIKQGESLEQLYLRKMTAFLTQGLPVRVENAALDDFEKNISGIANYTMPADIYGTPVPEVNNPPGAEMVMDSGGHYTLKAKAGTYKFDVLLCSPGAKNNSGCSTSQLEITINLPDSNVIGTSQGALPVPDSKFDTLQFRPILQKCIKEDILREMQLIRANYLLKTIQENLNKYHKIFIQAEPVYIKAIKSWLIKN